MHRNKKRFVCELCGNAFNAHYTLKEHRAYVHSEVRKHNCSKCDKKFKAKNALIRHEQVHSESRPFKCDLCNQEYKRQSHLRRHLVTSHQGEAEEEDGRARDHREQEEGARLRDWGEGREVAVRAPGSISATAALDVVTTLDLNIRAGRPVKVEGKPVKAERACGYQDRQEASLLATLTGPDTAFGQPGPDQYNDPTLERQPYEPRAYPQRSYQEARPYQPASPYPPDSPHQQSEPRDQEGRYSAPTKGYLPPVSPYRAPAKGYPPPAQPYQEPAKGYQPPNQGPTQPYQPQGPGQPYQASSQGYQPHGQAYQAPGQGRSQPPEERPYRQEGERAYPEQRYSHREAQPYLDSVPADLTMASSSSSSRYPTTASDTEAMTASGREVASARELPYPRAQAGPRQRYSNYLQQQQRQPAATYYGSAHRERQGPGPPLPAGLEQLEDSAYRSLPDLGYPTRQPATHYFDQLDSYLHSGRDDLELGSALEKKHKTSSRREEGNLLPPLLALAPQDNRPGSPPHGLKMETYLACPGQDHLATAQYLQDGTGIDYNIDY
jgi:hypothetical protein